MDILAMLVLLGAGLAPALGAVLLQWAVLYRRGSRAERRALCLLIGAALALFAGGFPLYAAGIARMPPSDAQPAFSATVLLTTSLAGVLLFEKMLSVLLVVGTAALAGAVLMLVA